MNEPRYFCQALRVYYGYATIYYVRVDDYGNEIRVKRAQLESAFYFFGL